jgi:hypothetical protein
MGTAILFAYIHTYIHGGRDRAVGKRLTTGRTIRRFSVPVEISPAAHPASCTMRTGSFQGVTRPEGGDDHPPFANVAVNGLQPYLRLLSASAEACSKGKTLTLCTHTCTMELVYVYGIYICSGN